MLVLLYPLQLLPINNHMSTNVKSLLTKSGWFKERRVEEKKVLEWIVEARLNFGCHIFPEAVRILTSYGGLIVGSSKDDYSLKIGPFSNEFYGDAEGWLWWEWRIKKVLFPIASYVGNDVTFAVSSDGGIYGIGYGDWFCGNNFADAVKNLFFKRDFIRDFTEEVITPDAVLRQEQSERVYKFLSASM